MLASHSDLSLSCGTYGRRLISGGWKPACRAKYPLTGVSRHRTHRGRTASCPISVFNSRAFPSQNDFLLNNFLKGGLVCVRAASRRTGAFFMPLPWYLRMAAGAAHRRHSSPENRHFSPVAARFTRQKRRLPALRRIELCRFTAACGRRARRSFHFPTTTAVVLLKTSRKEKALRG